MSDEARAPRRPGRRHRRVVRPATGGDDGPEPRVDDDAAHGEMEQVRQRDHERWLKEQRPPHWG